MAKSKAPKNLEVDGTNKLAARSKASDKHEKAELNIEEATVASPRPSRKRTGDYFDFDGEDSAGEAPSNSAVAPKTEKPKKKPKTAATDKTEKPNKGETKPSAKEKKTKGGKDDAPKAPKEKPTKAVTEKKEKAPKSSKEERPKKDEAESSKKPKKDKSKSGAGKELTGEPAPEAEADKPESKAKKPKAGSKKNAASPESAAIDADLAMDEGPLESLLGNKDGKAADDVAGQPADSAGTVKDSSSAKKAAKVPKAQKGKSAKPAAVEVAKKGSKDGAENATEVADSLKKAVTDGTEKAKKTAKAKAPTTETAAEVADTLKKEVKAGSEKAKKAAKSQAVSTETPVEVANTAKKGTKAAAEKVQKAVKPNTDDAAAKKAKPVKQKDMVKKSAPTDEQTKPEAFKSKKRKAPAGDAETVKTDLLDPLAEHAEASTKKKQKKEKAKSKSLGGAVGDLLSSAAESANAARASLGGFANSLMGAAAEVAEGPGDAIEATKSVAKKAKGKGKAIAEDVAESTGKAIAALEASTDADDDDSDSDAEPDDHTAALLAGFESEGDEAPTSGPGFEEGEQVPKIPDAKKTAEKIKGIKVDADEGTGVVYVGRIPHGFYEHQMRQYFSQFGDINRLRLSRNRKTGQSRHYSFLEFKSAGVAKIVADTMDNYLMFGHILKCKVVPPEQLHEKVWKGADKRFKKVPWNKMEGRKLEMGVGRDQWTSRNEKEEKRRESKKEKLKEIGYEFEAPPLKGVDQVAVKDTPKEIENGEAFEEEQSLVTGGAGEDAGAMVVSEEVKTKKTKKSGKGEPKETTTMTVKKTKRTLEGGEDAAGTKAKKAKKTKGAAA